MKKIIKGDKVRVISGKFKGQEGTVLSHFPKTQKVIVEGINKVKTHKKAQNNEPGGIIEKEAPLHVCKVTLVDGKIKTGVTKIAFTIDPKTKKKIRTNRKTGAPINVKK